MSKVIDTEELVEMISNKLLTLDGVSIEDAARNLNIETDYQGDSMFILKD